MKRPAALVAGLCAGARWRAVLMAGLCAGLSAASAPAARPESAPPPSPAVAVTSRPEGAMLSVDGVPRGVTPASVHLFPGRHVARLELEGAPATYAEFESGESPSDVFFELPAPSVTVLLDTEPQGAAATLDGAFVGTTPVLLPELAPGRHSFGLSLDGHRDAVLEEDLAAPAPVRVFARLVPSSATLRVTSDPAGASVVVGGVPRGASPVDVSGIPEGETEVEVSLPGHASFRRRVKLASGDDVPLHAALEPLPTELRVVTVPAGASVYVDDEPRGAAPLAITNALPGSFRVRVRLEGYDPLARTVELGPGEHSTQEFRLRPNTGSVSLSTSPALVTVSVDGRRAGATEAKPGASDAVSRELVLRVPAGVRTVELSRPGYRTETRTVEVGRDRTATLGTIELERLFIPDVAVVTRNGTTVRGMFKERSGGFYRVETAPGLVHSIPLADIESVQTIRSDAGPDTAP